MIDPYEDRLSLREAAKDVIRCVWTESEALADLAITFGRRPVPEREWRRILREERGDEEWEQMKQWSEMTEGAIG